MSEADLDRRLELVVKALVFPMLHLRAHDRDPSFGRVLAHETMDPSSEQRGFIREMFDPIARAVVDSLTSALPGRSEQEIWWAYELMLGAMVYVMGDAGRIERLSGGLCARTTRRARSGTWLRFSPQACVTARCRVQRN